MPLFYRLLRRGPPAIQGLAVLMVLTAAAIPGWNSAAWAADVPPQRFATAAQAATALLSAVRAEETATLTRILGTQSADLIESGDPVADHNARADFITAHGKMNKILFEGQARAVLILGADAWPFPIPLAKTDQKWHFDTDAGRAEILDRRIGRNELNAIEVCRTYVEAQAEYAGRDPLGNGFPEYAQRILSSPERHDGLYWAVATDAPQSPLGPLIASAQAEGYGPDAGAARRPYHGYFYKILTRQEAAAADGARDYIVNGHMIGGFALLAFPARYGDSGIMSFMVSDDGIVYQKDLGADTPALAEKITAFNPDKGWVKP